MHRRASIAILASLIVVLAITTRSVSSAGTCQFNAFEYTSFDSVWQCFRSIPLIPDVKHSTIGALQRAVELYAFLDIARDSPDPNLPMQVKILEGLQAIEKRIYKFDFDFHDDLRQLFLELNDAHTQYYLPNCYRSLSMAQPFAPISYVQSGKQVVSIAPFFYPPMVEYYQSTFGIDVTAYQGALIQKVDGVSAVEYFSTYANSSIGMCKDYGTRFNEAMTIVKPQPNFPDAVLPGYWQNRTKRNPVPNRPYVDYTLQLQDGSITNISIPWIAQSIKTYTGLSSFMDDYWAVPINRSHFDNSLLQERLNSPAIDREEPLYLTRMPRRRTHAGNTNVVNDHTKPRQVDASNTFTLLVNSTNLKFWKLSDDQTLVMYLDTMAPNSLAETFKALNQGFEAAADNNLSRLIIDLTDNGGGSICFGQSLLAYLQGEDPVNQNWGPQDLPCSPLQTNLTLSAVSLNVSDTVWSPGFYDNQQDQHVANNDTSYLIPGVPHVRGGLLRNYSRLVHINNCGNFGYRIKPAKYFSASEILIVTHGFCGSTCALFANHLRLYDNVHTVVVGGLTGRNQQYTSFPGLQVLDSPDLYQQLAQLGQDISIGMPAKGELCPRQLMTTAYYRMCIREIYPPVKKYSNKPIEFTFQQADYHLDNSAQTAVAPEQIWYQVVNLFPSSRK